MPTDVQQEDPFGIHSAIDQKHSNGAITAGHFNVAMGSGKFVNDLPNENLHLSRDFPLPCCLTTKNIYIYICLSPLEDWLSTKNWIDWIWPFTTIGIAIPHGFLGFSSCPGPVQRLQRLQRLELQCGPP